MTEPDSQKDIIEEAKGHLSDTLRSLFKLKGYDTVQTEVLARRYKNHDKQLAAHAWLLEKRRWKEIRQFWIPVAISVVALIVSLIALSK